MKKDAQLMSGIEQVYMEVTRDFWERTGGLKLRKLDGLFTFSLTAWLMLWQKLMAENSMAATVQDLQKKIEAEEEAGILDWVKGSRKVRFKDISGNTGGFSQARERLPLSMVEDLADEIHKRIIEERRGKNLWRERRVFLIDGTDIAFINTPDLLKAFPPQQNNGGDCFPIARVVVAHDLVNGVAVRPEIGTQYESEQSLARRMMPRLERGSIIMGDRNFGVFSIAYHTHENHLEAALRLQKERVGKLIGHDNLDRDGEYQVVWTPSSDDLKTNPDIPKTAQVKGKVVVVTGERNGFRPKRFYFFLTPQVQDILPAELLEFYDDRWFVETDLRSIKYTINLETISVQTADMARKEIILGVCGYNLVRAIVARGTEQIHLHPRDISFTRAVLLIKATAELLIRSKTNKQRQSIREKFLVKLRQIKLPKRKMARVEPRLVVRQKKSFPALRGSRQAARLKLIEELS